LVDSSLLSLFKNLNIFLKLPSLTFLQKSFSTVFYEAKTLPLMSLLQPRNPFKPHWRVWNALSLFPDRTLYIRYLRRQFFLSPSFITSRSFLEDRIVDLNFFLLLLFQSFSLNKTARLSQIIYF
jgi:hypothetical protein